MISVSQFPFKSVKKRFPTSQQLGVHLPDELFMVQMTGVAKVDICGDASGSWSKDVVQLTLSYRDTLPEDQGLSVQQWTHTVTPARWSNDNVAHNHGIGIRLWEHGSSGSAAERALYASDWQVKATVSIRDSDAHLLGLAYSVTLIGTLGEHWRSRSGHAR